MANGKQITVDDVRLLDVKNFVGFDGEEGRIHSGNLVPLSSNNEIPFDIKRLFYVWDVPDATVRGKHAHYKTKQVLICIRGKILVTCKDGKNQVKYLLDTPQQALYIPELIWDEQIYFSSDSILLVVSNTDYDNNDYILDYGLFQRIKEGKTNAQLP